MSATLSAVGTVPASADETTVGPCTYNLGDPHLSTAIVAGVGMTVMRAHVVYRCTNNNLLYVNAHSTMRYCGAQRLPALSCPKTGSGPQESNSHTNAQNNIHTGASWSAPFTTSDSDPNPEPGWYVATAVYEVCFFNGGATTGTGTSNFAYLDSDGKVKIVREVLGG